MRIQNPAFITLNNFKFVGLSLIAGILLLVEMTCGILGFIFKDWIKAQATNGFQAFIVHYRYQCSGSGSARTFNYLLSRSGLESSNFRSGFRTESTPFLTLNMEM
jgi:hypothetical protein